MRIGAAPVMQATRRYLWDFEGGLVIVRFADGRDFHSFAPAGQVAGTDHPCGDDHYTVVYDFTPLAGLARDMGCYGAAQGLYVRYRVSRGGALKRTLQALLALRRGISDKSHR